MAIAIFVCGPAGSGKSTLSKMIVRRMRGPAGAPFCILDKDVLTDPLSEALLFQITGSGLDRDSAAYKAHVRDPEYACVLATAKENLELGMNVILPGPWSREIASGALYRASTLGFPADTKMLLVWLDVPEDERRSRVALRGNPRDAYKLKNWSEYVNRMPGHVKGAPDGMLVLGPMLNDEQKLQEVENSLKPIL